MRKQLIFILIVLSIHNISFAQENEILETYTLNYVLTATLSAGESIFWKLSKDKTL